MTAAVRAYIEGLARNRQREDLRVTEDGRVVGRFQGGEIASVFQPIARIGCRTVTAVQALARTCGEVDGEAPPAHLFSLASSDDELVLLDRRCRIVHTLNFFAGEDNDRQLLLCVHPRLLAAVATDHGRAFRRVLDSFAVSVTRAVIALPPLQADTVALQAQVVASYRLNGFRVAVTAPRPDVLRALAERLPADVVRVEARQLRRGDWDDVLRGVRQQGSELHITRVEDEDDLALAIEQRATHWQGWHLSRPVHAAPAWPLAALA